MSINNESLALLPAAKQAQIRAGWVLNEILLMLIAFVDLRAGVLHDMLERNVRLESFRSFETERKCVWIATSNTLANSIIKLNDNPQLELLLNKFWVVVA